MPRILTLTTYHEPAEGGPEIKVRIRFAFYRGHKATWDEPGAEAEVEYLDCKPEALEQWARNWFQDHEAEAMEEVAAEDEAAAEYRAGA